MTLQTRRELADRLLRFLADTGERSWPRTHDIMLRASQPLGLGLCDIWKAYELLRQLGRIELVNPNGQHGLRLVDITPLTMPGISIEHRDNTAVVIAIIQDLYKRFPTEVRAAFSSLPKEV